VALIVLDASVLIGHFDHRDRHHTSAAAAIREREAEDLVVPASAYAETMVGPVRRGAGDLVRDSLRLLEIRIEPITAIIGELAARLRAEHTALKLPDALVLACAEALVADEILTADARWTRWSPRARTI